MRTLLRRIAATTAALGSLAVGAIALAPTASAASCGSWTHMTVDNRGYSGPWPDNWDLSAKVCSYRAGSTIYSYAHLAWDNPGTSWEGGPFDNAAFRVYLKKHDGNDPDPIVKYRTFHIEDRMENGDGSYRTPTISAPISRYALGDGAWKLNWDNDGDGYVHYGVSASDRV